MIFNLLSVVLAANPNFKPEVLGPLAVLSDSQLEGFKYQLRQLKSIGVESIATDIWWGVVEPAQDQFDFSYYDKLSAAIIDAGLNWIPIMSTHQCGEPGSKDCYYPVPAWTGIAGNANLGFVDAFNSLNTESFSPWAGEFPYQRYDKLFSTFASHYASLSKNIPRIDLSGGTSGELRYPSYSNSWSYPQRGRLQAYSAPAIRDFQNWTITKYSNLNGVNRAWGASLKNVGDITPPCDVTTQSVQGVCAGKTGQDTFFSSGYQTAYGQDFANWYQNSLLVHSRRLTDLAKKNFKVFDNVKIAMKMSGVHWQYFNPTEPHSAERSAGYWDYSVFLKEFKSQNIQATFTAIEMNDNNNDAEHSGAKTLTTQFYSLCQQIGTECGSENALPVSAGGDQYPNMRAVLTRFSVDSITLLRYDSLLSSDSNMNAYLDLISSVGKNAVQFKVGSSLEFGQQLGVQVGNDVVKLSALNCNGKYCDWTGVLRTTSTNLEAVFTVLGQSPAVSCSSLKFNINTPSTHVIVRQGLGSSDQTQNGVRFLQFAMPDISCRPNGPSPNPPPPTPPVPTPTPPTPYPTKGTAFVVDHNTNGGTLSIVGSFNSWNTCAGIPCQNSGNTWFCGPVDIKGRVEWKSITVYGGNCKSASYRGGNNLVVVAGDDVAKPTYLSQAEFETFTLTAESHIKQYSSPMNFLLLLTACLAYVAEERPPLRQRIGHSIKTGFGKTWNATKYVGGKISRGAKITTHKVLSAIEHSADYLDKKVVKSIKPELVTTSPVQVSQ